MLSYLGNAVGMNLSTERDSRENNYFFPKLDKYLISSFCINITCTEFKTQTLMGSFK